MDKPTRQLVRHCEVLYEQRQYGRAARLLGDAVGREPDSVPVLALLAHALRMVSRYDEAIDCARRVVALQPTQAGSHGLLAGVLIGAGQHEEAITTAEEAIRLDPRVPGGFWAVASASYELGQFSQAVRAARRGLAIHPRAMHLRQHLAMSLAADGHGPEAVRLITAVLAEAPAQPSSHTAAGWTYLRMDLLDVAATHFLKALELDPTFPWQHEGLGFVRFEQGRLVEARAHLAEAFRLDPALRNGRRLLEQLEATLPPGSR